MPKETRVPKPESASPVGSGTEDSAERSSRPSSDFGLRNSFGIRNSGFGFLPKRFIQHFEEMIGSTLLVAMCAIAMLQAGSRFLSRVTEIKPVYWTEEACTLLFIWLCFVGASYALRTGDHFAVEVLREKLPLKARRIVLNAGLVCVAGFCALLIWYGGDLAIRSVHVTTPSLEISRSIAYAAVPAGGFLMLVRTIEMLFRRRKEDGRPTTDHGSPAPEQSSALDPTRKETAE